MDIQYLLWLQAFRNNINDALTPFMEWVSMFATNYLLLFAVFYYWYRSKKGGLYALGSFALAIMLNTIVKLTACVYRPWIRDPRIVPAGDSIKTATGYSFPSGHTITAGALAGGMAVNLWKDVRMRWASVLFVLFILVTGFSRNYLGVHTPQDVLVGLLLSVFSLFITAKILAYLDEHPEKEDFILLTGFILCCVSLVYITFKSYPITLDGEGKLIVDPQKMMNDGYGDIGKLLGFIIGRYIEKTWVRFEPAPGSWKGILICLLGLIPMVLLRKLLYPAMISWFGGHWGKLSFNIIYPIYYIALYPIVLKCFCPAAARD